MKILYSVILVTVTVLLNSCINPFAPALSDEEYSQNIGNQKTIDGFFQNFLYAYNMKDTVIYSNLIASDFIFAYRDYEKEIDRTFSRQEDMTTTYRLFNASQHLNFIWNEILSETGTDTDKSIIRSFSLTIVFNPTDIVNVEGKVHFNVKRQTAEDNWQLSYWRDDSYY